MIIKTIDTSDPFRSSLKLSLIAHGLIVAFTLVRAYVFPAEKFEYSSAVRVDIVALPDKIDPSQVLLTHDKPEPQKPPDPKVNSKPESLKIQDTKTKQSQALEKIKQATALEKIKNQIEKENSNGKAQKISQVKGNIISAGTALTGLNKLQHEQYVSTLDQHIKQNWAIPEWMAKREFKAQARVKIDNNGLIISRAIVKTSGNASYDELVLETIDKSAPFPRPPEKFTDILSVQGILLGFPE